MSTAPAAPPSPSSWLPKPTLRGELVELRPPVREDAWAIAELLADEELLRFTGSVTSQAEARAFPTEPSEEIIDWYASRAGMDQRLDLIIVDRASGRPVGEAVLNDVDVAASSCNFRILIGTPGRNRGLGTEATRLTVGYGFEQIGLHRIELGVYAFNPRALRSYEKVGFVVEGARRDAFRYRWDEGGEQRESWTDEIIMSILAPEWEQHRGRPTL